MQTTTAPRSFARTALALAHALALTACATGTVVTPGEDASTTHHDVVVGTDVPTTTHPDVPVVTGTDVPVVTGTDVPVVMGTDVPTTGCSAASECTGAANACCSAVCVDTMTDPNNCGVCTHACGAGAACCAGGCVPTQTDVNNCGTCGHACGALANATAACAGGACAVGACNAGFADCDTMATTGCETNTATDGSNCGACGHACGAGSTCAAGTCTTPGPANDRASGATPLTIAPTGTTITGDTTGAGNESTCGSGPDVYYSFTVSARTILYADTFGTAWDTKLAIATAATGNTTCVDDACGVLQSQLTAVLNPGTTYYLIVAGFIGTSFGPFTLHVQSLAAGSGVMTPITMLPVTSGMSTGSTTGAGVIVPTCGSFGPDAGENALYWGSCPSGGGSVDATFCGSGGTASYDTVLYVRHGNGAAEACNDDGADSACGLHSHLSATFAAGAGLHALFIDGYNGLTGSYTLHYAIP